VTGRLHAFRVFPETGVATIYRRLLSDGTWEPNAYSYAEVETEVEAYRAETRRILATVKRKPLVVFRNQARRRRRQFAAWLLNVCERGCETIGQSYCPEAYLPPSA
jgi:hypothetical protein